jgi:hypothetical protein
MPRTIRERERTVEFLRQLFLSHDAFIGLAVVVCGIVLGCGMGIAISLRWPS